MLIMAMDEGMIDGQYAFMSNEALIYINKPQWYRPEVDSIIINGMIGIGVANPSGTQWDHFRQQVIDAFQDVRFENLTHLPPGAYLDDVNVYAGR